MSEQEINTTIQNLVKHGFGRQQAIDVYFSANPNAKRDPNASYNFEDVSSAVEAAVKKHHHEIPAHVKETDSDDDYGSIVSMTVVGAPAVPQKKAAPVVPSYVKEDDDDDSDYGSVDDESVTFSAFGTYPATKPGQPKYVNKNEIPQPRSGMGHARPVQRVSSNEKMIPIQQQQRPTNGASPMIEKKSVKMDAPVREPKKEEERILIKVGSRATLAHQQSYKFNAAMSLLTPSNDSVEFDLEYDPFEFGVEQLMLKGYDRQDAIDIYKRTHTVEEGGDIVTKVYRPEEEVIEQLYEEGYEEELEKAVSQKLAKAEAAAPDVKKEMTRRKSALGDEWSAMAFGGNTGIKEKDDVAHEITRRKSFVLDNHGKIEDRGNVKHIVGVVEKHGMGSNRTVENKKKSHEDLHEQEAVQRNEILQSERRRSLAAGGAGGKSAGGGGGASISDSEGGRGHSTNTSTVKDSFASEMDQTKETTEKTTDLDPKDSSKEARAARRNARKKEKDPYTEDDEAQIEKIMMAGYSRLLAEERWDQMKKRGERPTTPDGLKTHARVSRGGSAGNSGKNTPGQSPGHSRENSSSGHIELQSAINSMRKGSNYNMSSNDNSRNNSASQQDLGSIIAEAQRNTANAAKEGTPPLSPRGMSPQKPKFNAPLGHSRSNSTDASGASSGRGQQKGSLGNTRESAHDIAVHSLEVEDTDDDESYGDMEDEEFEIVKLISGGMTKEAAVAEVIRRTHIVRSKSMKEPRQNSIRPGSGIAATPSTDVFETNSGKEVPIFNAHMDAVHHNAQPHLEGPARYLNEQQHHHNHHLHVSSSMGAMTAAEQEENAHISYLMNNKGFTREEAIKEIIRIRKAAISASHHSRPGSVSDSTNHSRNNSTPDLRIATGSRPDSGFNSQRNSPSVEREMLNALLFQRGSITAEAPRSGSGVISPRTTQGINSRGLKSDEEALRNSLITSHQEAEFGFNMYTKLKLTDEAELDHLMDMGYLVDDAVHMIFNRRYPSKLPDAAVAPPQPHRRSSFLEDEGPRVETAHSPALARLRELAATVHNQTIEHHDHHVAHGGDPLAAHDDISLGGGAMSVNHSVGGHLHQKYYRQQQQQQQQKQQQQERRQSALIPPLEYPSQEPSSQRPASMSTFGQRTPPLSNSSPRNNYDQYQPQQQQQQTYTAGGGVHDMHGGYTGSSASVGGVPSYGHSRGGSGVQSGYHSQSHSRNSSFGGNQPGGSVFWGDVPGPAARRSTSHLQQQPQQQPQQQQPRQAFNSRGSSPNTSFYNAPPPPPTHIMPGSPSSHSQKNGHYSLSHSHHSQGNSPNTSMYYNNNSNNQMAQGALSYPSGYTSSHQSSRHPSSGHNSISSKHSTPTHHNDIRRDSFGGGGGSGDMRRDSFGGGGGGGGGGHSQRNSLSGDFRRESVGGGYGSGYNSQTHSGHNSRGGSPRDQYGRGGATSPDQYYSPPPPPAHQQQQQQQQVSPHPRDVSTLMDMGFQRSAAVQALVESNNNVTVAAERLMR